MISVQINDGYSHCILLYTASIPCSQFFIGMIYDMRIRIATTTLKNEIKFGKAYSKQSSLQTGQFF